MEEHVAHGEEEFVTLYIESAEEDGNAIALQDAIGRERGDDDDPEGQNAGEANQNHQQAIDAIEGRKVELFLFHRMPSLSVFFAKLFASKTKIIPMSPRAML